MRNFLVLAAALATLSGAAQAQPRTEPAPIVVELFQSQGCSSCPPANAILNQIADYSGVIALNYGVTYWDDLGWKDTFAKPAFTARQRAYARGLGNATVGTPQMVINGASDLVGSNPTEVQAALRAADPPDLAKVSLGAHAVAIEAVAHRAAADVWLVRFDPRVRNVSIKRGENGGKTLPHKNVVVDLVRLGAWDGAAKQFTPPAAKDASLRTAVLVQARDGGPILGAALAP